MREFVPLIVPFMLPDILPCFADDREFQLITWSKDNTLRFWPIDLETAKVKRPHNI